MSAVATSARQQWAGRIAAAWNKSVQGIIETGQLLIDAKASLDHGEFENMVENDLPFQPTTAQRLMKVSRDDRLANPARVQLLPPSWGTLYELTKLTDAQFEAGVKSGLIRPDMLRTAIRAENRKLTKAPPARWCTNTQNRYGGVFLRNGSALFVVGPKSMVIP